MLDTPHVFSAAVADRCWSPALLLSLLMSLFMAPPAAAAGVEDCGSQPPALVELPEPAFRGAPLEEVIAARRTVRYYSPEPLGLQELSQILWSAQGITDSARGMRAAPSAGGTYPIDLYVQPNNVLGLECGVYRYEPRDHRLVLYRAGRFRDAVHEAALGQRWVYTAGAVILFVATPARVAEKYDEASALKSTLLEAGHISQNIYLQATSMGLGVGAIGGFSTEAMGKLLGLAEGQKVVYLNLVGNRR